ncbi:hypothetical protein QAD02_019081 [Eretmocerus hayati]|uniref:Uncharacterized protein n=1 Tax=Eretmocerus hayati TaxID=131215 RepID=A0ACC2PI68_9HYME|nr:hypothetical protein QAD02_019081 [Eretmocerus hayati]
MPFTSWTWQNIAIGLVSLLLILLSFALIHTKFANMRSPRSTLLEALANMSRSLDKLHNGLEDISERAIRARISLDRLTLNCGVSSLGHKNRLENDLDRSNDDDRDRGATNTEVT